MKRLLCWLFGHPGYHADTEGPEYFCVRCRQEWRIVS